MMKKQVKCIHIRGRVGMVTTNDVYSSDHLPDRFKPLQYIMEVDDFTSMDITLQDVHYAITLEDTGEPPRDDDPGEHTEKINGTEPHAVLEQEYYHEVLDRYYAVHEHHHALITHHHAVQAHYHLVQDRYSMLMASLRTQDKDHAWNDYRQALLDHRNMVQEHQDLLQKQYSLLLDLQSAEENGHSHHE